MEKGTKLKIKLTTEMVQDGQKETHHFDVLGEGYLKNETLYLLYKEEYDQIEGGPLTVPVMLKITAAGVITLTRTTTQRSKLTFDLGTVTTTQYQTPYGVMVLTVATEAIQHEPALDQMAGHLQVAYQLKAEQGILGHYHLTLDYQEITDQE